jgi:hypothetical protein
VPVASLLRQLPPAVRAVQDDLAGAFEAYPGGRSVRSPGSGPRTIGAFLPTAPDSLTLIENRDLRGHRRRLLGARRAGLAAFALIPLLALFNLFGQRPETSSASTSAAKLSVYAPVHARGGVVYAARFTIDALRSLKKATLILDPGWAEQYTVNGLSPQPVSEGSSNGKLVFDLGHIPEGQHYTVFLSLQVNPTNVGHRNQRVWLYDGSKELLAVDRTITVFP